MNLTALLDAPSHIPIVRAPSLAPAVLEALKLEGVRGDMPQNLSKPLRLSELMPKLPVLPSFTPPVFGPSTTDADVVSNVTAAARALLVPLVESTMLPSYAAALRARVADEAKWLEEFTADRARQQKLCGFFTQYMNNCVAFTAKMQAAKVQAIGTALDVLTSMEGQLNADMATKMAAFNMVGEARGGGGARARQSGLPRRRQSVRRAGRAARAGGLTKATCLAPSRARHAAPPLNLPPAAAALHQGPGRQLAVRGRGGPEAGHPRGRGAVLQRGLRRKGCQRLGQAGRLHGGPLGRQPLVAHDGGHRAQAARHALPRRPVTSGRARRLARPPVCPEPTRFRCLLSMSSRLFFIASAAAAPPSWRGRCRALQ